MTRIVGVSGSPREKMMDVLMKPLRSEDIVTMAILF